MSDSLPEFIERARSTFDGMNAFVVNLEQRLQVEPFAYQAVATKCKRFIHEHAGRMSVPIDTTDWPDEWKNRFNIDFISIHLFRGDPEQLETIMRAPYPVTYLPFYFEWPLEWINREASQTLFHLLLPKLLELVFRCPTYVKRRRCRDALLDACLEYRELAGIDWSPPQASTTASSDGANIMPKRSTESGEAKTKLIAALTAHHKYADGNCLNMVHVGNNHLARLAGVAESSASEFFKKEFKGHSKYKVCCQDRTTLVAALKLLNQEFSPHWLYGRNPSGEDDRDDE